MGKSCAIEGAQHFVILGAKDSKAFCIRQMRCRPQTPSPIIPRSPCKLHALHISFERICCNKKTTAQQSIGAELYGFILQQDS